MIKVGSIKEQTIDMLNEWIEEDYIEGNIDSQEDIDRIVQNYIEGLHEELVEEVSNIDSLDNMFPDVKADKEE